MVSDFQLKLDNKNIDTVLVLDFGSQYTQLIARRIRELEVYSEILPWDIDPNMIRNLHPKGVILSGGPESVTQQHTPRIPEVIFELDIPILGICYGMQTLAEQFGGQVISSDKKEFGFAEVTLQEQSILLQNINESILKVWMSHGDCVSSLPKDFKLIGSTETSNIVMMEHASKPIYALQFHPEVTHTEEGQNILENFIVEVCHCNKDWQMQHLIENRIAEIREQTGNSRVLLGLSGGCLLYTSPSPRDVCSSRMPSSA